MSNWPSAKYKGMRDLPLPFEADRIEIELFDGNESFDFCVTTDGEVFDCLIECEGTFEFSDGNWDDVAEKITNEIFEEVISNGSLSNYIRNIVDEWMEDYDFDPDLDNE